MKKIILLHPDDRKYLFGLRYLILLSAIIFLGSTIVGFYSVNLYPEKIQTIISPVQNLAEKTQGLSSLELFGLIFLNNGLKIIGAVILGVFFGIVPLIFIVVNGYLVGVVAFITQKTSGWSLFWLGILPHGILEVPSLVIGAAVGIKLGKYFTQSIFGTEKNIKNEIIKALIFSVRFLIPIILFAAFIETFISQIIISTIR